jgi:hypothetical protein
MTLRDAQKHQAAIAAKEQEPRDGTNEAEFTLRRDQWLNDPTTIHMLSELRDATKLFDERAKALAMQNESQSASAIRALLIESATINKVLDYVTNCNRTDKYE